LVVRNSSPVGFAAVSPSVRGSFAAAAHASFFSGQGEQLFVTNDEINGNCGAAQPQGDNNLIKNGTPRRAVGYRFYLLRKLKIRFKLKLKFKLLK